jgi:hypothetical protein
MDQRAILAAVNNSAPVGAKGFWWNIADLRASSNSALAMLNF